jgi:hypothetical protein
MRRPGKITIIAALALLGISPGWAQIRNPVDNSIDMRAPEGRPDTSSVGRSWSNFQDNCDRETSPGRSNCTTVRETRPPPPPIPCAPYFYYYPYFYPAPGTAYFPYYGGNCLY